MTHSRDGVQTQADAEASSHLQVGGEERRKLLGTEKEPESGSPTLPGLPLSLPVSEASTGCDPPGCLEHIRGVPGTAGAWHQTPPRTPGDEQDRLRLRVEETE